MFAVCLYHSGGKEQSGLFRVGFGVLWVCRGPARSPKSLEEHCKPCTCCSEHSEKLVLTSRDNVSFPGISFKSEPCDIFTMDFSIAWNLHSLSAPHTHTPWWAANTQINFSKHRQWELLCLHVRKQAYRLGKLSEGLKTLMTWHILTLTLMVILQRPSRK